MRSQAYNQLNCILKRIAPAYRSIKPSRGYSQTLARLLEQTASFMVAHQIVDDYPMLVFPKLAAKLGGSDEAIFVAQLHYWLRKSRHIRPEDGQRWIWNRLDDWLKQMVWLTKRSLRTIIYNLEKLGVVVSEQFQSKDWNQIKWYRLDYDKLAEIGWNPHGYADVKNDISMCQKRHLDVSETADDHYLQRLHSEITLSPPTPSQEREREIEQKYLEEDKPGSMPHPFAAIEIKTEIEDQPADLKKGNFSGGGAALPNDDTKIKLEWEAAPGRPYPDFVKWRSQHYIDQGGHWAKAAIANARSEIRNNPNRAADLWEQFLNYADRAADSALAHKDNGMVPTLPPCFQESQESALVTKESVTAKLAAVVTPTAAIAPADPTPPPTARLTPPPNADNVGAYKLFSPEEIEVSPIPDSFKAAFSQLVAKQSMSKQKLRDVSPPPIFPTQPDLAAAQEAWAALPDLRDQIRSEITAHPDWDLEVVDNCVQAVCF